MKNTLQLLACSPCALLFLACASFLRSAETPDRVILFPRLVAGQSVTYEIGYRAQTTTNTESNVAAPMAPIGGPIEAHLFLQVEVENLTTGAAAKPVARLLTRLLPPDSLPANGNAASSVTPANNASPPKVVEFTLHANGEVTDVTGLDALTPDEKAAWQEWVARFGVGAALPEKGVKPGEKWHVEEPITTALLTGLSWDKESQYVDDEPCGPRAGPNAAISAATAAEHCAVILTTATIKQKNPQKDATPEDYKLHDLRTYGLAKGRNEIITYISLKTGIVVRATEDANQSLNVIVAKTDGSNRVHYIIDAQSHAQVLLKTAPSPNHP